MITIFFYSGILIHYVIENIKIRQLISYKPKNHKNKVINTELTLDEIKRSLPDKIYQKNIFKACYYIFRDLALIKLLIKFFKNSKMKKIFILPLHAFFQGTLLMGLFTLGHDCGHGGFSDYKHLNFLLGLTCHSVILVPFTPWRLTHINHHKHTGDIDKDEVFFPEYNDYHNLVKLPFGWIIYCWFGGGSRNKHAIINLFNPLFKNYRGLCLLSYGCMSLVVLFLLKFTNKEFILFYYLPSLMVIYMWLVFITIMHHQEETILWKENPKKINGLIESTDYNYGIFHNLIHNIGTHQVHHLDPRIPFYNLPLATFEFRKRYPQICKMSSKPVLTEFIRLANIRYKARKSFDTTKRYKYFNFFGIRKSN